MDPITLLVILCAVILLVAALTGRIDTFAALIGIVLLVVVLYAVPHVR